MSVASKVPVASKHPLQIQMWHLWSALFPSFYVEICKKTFYAWQAIIFDVSTDDWCYQTSIDKTLKDFTCSKNCNEKHLNVSAET